MKSKTREENKKAHAWRLCPLGQHWVRTHPLHLPPSEAHPEGKITTRHEHCAHNPTGKDQLYSDEIQEIAKLHFKNLKNLPKDDSLDFDNGNAFDNLIGGWTQYWNEVLNPKEPLDPDLVKALIASESSFNIHASNHRKGDNRARGLMQVTDGSVNLLSERSNELKDHFVNVTHEDMEDPNLAICAGIRWLFRKNDIAEAKVGKSVTWRDAVLKYKDYKTNDPHMKKFDDAYARLKME